MTIEEASTWMDEVRSEPEYKYMAPWHYINFPKGTMYQPTNEPNVVNALTSTINSLERNSTLPYDSIRFNLLVIMHLNGDIHQPLHTGYAADKGGNDYQVSFLGKGSNLHRVWDSEIIEHQNITLENCLKVAEQFSQTERQQVLRSNVVDWMNNSRSLLINAYPQAHEIDETYIQEKTLVIERQLAIAGLRLAAILQQVASHLQPAKAVTTVSVNKSTIVTLKNLREHIGEMVQVCGRVYGTKYLINTKSTPTFINVGAPYPNAFLTLVIWQEVRDTFSYTPDTQLDNKNICVIGKLELYKDKPEIVIQKESDITIQQ